MTIPSEKTDPPAKRPAKGWIKGMGNASRYANLGIQAGVAVGFYLGVGLLLDHWLDTLPWLTLLGAMIGIVAMFALFFRVNKELSRRHDEEN